MSTDPEPDFPTRLMNAGLAEMTDRQIQEAIQETAQALVDHGHAATLPDAVQALSDALTTPVTRRMTPEDAVTALDALNGDPDGNHGAADQILLSVAPPEVAAAYQRLVDRSDWWATA